MFSYSLKPVYYRISSFIRNMHKNFFLILFFILFLIRIKSNANVLAHPIKEMWTINTNKQGMWTLNNIKYYKVRFPLPMFKARLSTCFKLHVRFLRNLEGSLFDCLYASQLSSKAKKQLRSDPVERTKWILKPKLQKMDNNLSSQ